MHFLQLSSAHGHHDHSHSHALKHQDSHHQNHHDHHHDHDHASSSAAHDNCGCGGSCDCSSTISTDSQDCCDDCQHHDAASSEDCQKKKCSKCWDTLEVSTYQKLYIMLAIASLCFYAIYFAYSMNGRSSMLLTLLMGFFATIPLLALVVGSAQPILHHMLAGNKDDVKSKVHELLLMPWDELLFISTQASFGCYLFLFSINITFFVHFDQNIAFWMLSLYAGILVPQLHAFLKTVRWEVVLFMTIFSDAITLICLLLLPFNFSSLVVVGAIFLCLLSVFDRQQERRHYLDYCCKLQDCSKAQQKKEEEFRDLRHFIANTAHDLKTVSSFL